MYICGEPAFPGNQIDCNMYKSIIRPVLFCFSAETAHKLTISALSVLRAVPFARNIVRSIFRTDSSGLEKTVFGLRFRNPVGLAGGLDKNGDHYNELSDFGFSFIEIGSLTPEPQDGNPKPRLFRVIQDRAIINRMGINNKGVRHAASNLKKRRPETIIAANISKNASCSNENAAEDYLKAFTVMYDFADMFVVNVSCPNVTGLTNLQDVSFLSGITDRLLAERNSRPVRKPLLIKLSPDISFGQVDSILEYSIRAGIDGVVAGNTTRSREGLTLSPEEIEKIGNGGMSGAPLYKKSLALVKHIAGKTGVRLPIIGVGGIMSPEQAEEMLAAGASLIEIYSGFIYEGPGLVKKIVRHLHNSLAK